jgi:hypothetical protein
VGTDDWLVLLQCLVEFLQCVVDAILTGVGGKELEQARQLTGAVGLQALRRIAQRRQVHAPQVLHHVRGQAHVFMVAAPTLGAQSSGLIRFRVADGYVRFHLPVRVRFQCRQEISLVVRVEVAEDVAENDVPDRIGVFWPMDVLGVQSRVGFV